MTLRFEAAESPLVQPAPVSELWYTRCPVPTASGIALELGWLAHEFDRLGIRLSSLRDSDAADVRLAHFNHSLPGLFREGGNIPGDLGAVEWPGYVGRGADLGRRISGHSGPARIRDCQPSRSARRAHRAAATNGTTHRFCPRHGAARHRERAGAWRAHDPKRRAGRHCKRATGICRRGTQRSLPSARGRSPVAGHVDAIYVKGAVGRGSAREHRLATVVDLGRHPDPLVRVNNGNPRPVTVDRRTARERPDLVARYLSVLIRAANWAKEHASEVTAIVAREVNRLPDDVHAGYGPDLTAPLTSISHRGGSSDWRGRRTFCCTGASSRTTLMSMAGSTTSRSASRRGYKPMTYFILIPRLWSRSSGSQKLAQDPAFDPCDSRQHRVRADAANRAAD